MRRYQLFEFLDQAWLPNRLRLAITGYLTAAYAPTSVPAFWAEMLVGVLEECGLDCIVDLASGSGGPMQLVVAEMAKLRCKPRVTLTDLYPVPTASSIEYWPTPVNASCVPAELRGLRTMFVAFHHFTPPMARAVLEDACSQHQPICIFEATSRTAGAIATTLMVPLAVLFLTPLVRPISVFQIFFTYLIPVIPLLVFWDGLVSHLRTYSAAELRELTADCSASDFVWESSLIALPRVPYKTAYLFGRPRL